jgi:hypothetical protein
MLEWNRGPGIAGAKRHADIFVTTQVFRPKTKSLQPIYLSPYSLRRTGGGLDLRGIPVGLLVFLDRAFSQHQIVISFVVVARRQLNGFLKANDGVSRLTIAQVEHSKVVVRFLFIARPPERFQRIVVSV